MLQDQALGGGKCNGERFLSHRRGIAAALGATGTPSGSSPSGMKSTPAIMNWISRAPSNSAASPDPHIVASRPAKAGDKLVTTKFDNSLTRGFAAITTETTNTPIPGA